MTDAFLLARVLLRFGESLAAVRDNLSAAAMDTQGHLWLAGDEPIGKRPTLLRLTRDGLLAFANPTTFSLTELFHLPEGEVDLECLDVQEGVLWFAGSHARKRKKIKSKKSRKENLQRLATVSPERARFALGRIPLLGGAPTERIDPPGKDAAPRIAGIVPFAEDGNALTLALAVDPHLGPFVANPIPSKDNGLDIEGLSVHGSRLFLGLRGPVLRGFAVVLDLEVDEARSAAELLFTERKAGGRPYRKHFLDLGGLGVRDLEFNGDDLLIIAGPTLETDGPCRLYRLKDALDLDEDMVTEVDSKRLLLVMEFPSVPGFDKAEGLIVSEWLGEPAVIVVYDTPAAPRHVGDDGVYADVFQLG